MFTITAVGNLGREPEAKEVNGNTVATFSLGARTGKDQTTWINCSVFGKRSETVMKYFKKGSKVTIQGRANLRSYQGQDGQTKTSLDVTVNDFTLPERSKEQSSKTLDPYDLF